MSILGMNNRGGGILGTVANSLAVSPVSAGGDPYLSGLLNPSTLDNRLLSLTSPSGLGQTMTPLNVGSLTSSVPGILPVGLGMPSQQQTLPVREDYEATDGDLAGGFLGNLSDEMAFGIASGLLQGPTRMPVSTAKKLTTGLLTGMQLERQAEQDKLTNLLTGAKVKEALGKGGERQFSEETNLRKDFNSASKTYVDRVGAYKALESLVSSSREKATPGTDMAIVYQYMKTMDPTSAVLQGEYASASQVGNLPTKLVNLYNSMVTGNSLREGQREDFLRAAGVSLKGHFDTHQNRVKEYESLANSYGVRSSNIVSDPLGGEFTPPEAPVGDLFEGSDIADGSETKPFFIMPDKNMTRERAKEVVISKKLPKGTHFKFRDENGTVVKGKVD